MVLLSSHFLEILLKILLWWTALCTWKYMPTKQSRVCKDSWIWFWQNTSRCSHFSWIQCSKKWLGCCCASRAAYPAWCPSSREWGPPGAAAGDICHLVQWWPGRERAQQEPLLQAGTALPSHSEMSREMLREPQACCGVPGGIKGCLLEAIFL